MNLLIIGQGGREHALAWKLQESSQVEQIFVYPGNPGMSLESKIKTLPRFSNENEEFKLLAQFAIDNKIELTIVGPEDYLAKGIVDFFEEKDLKIFGPGQKAAQIETSKHFAKSIMDKAFIPTAEYFASSDKSELVKYIEQYPENTGLVLKADGLAAGKGVIICASKQEALSSLETLTAKHQKIIIEEKLQGPEFSYFTLIQGTNYRLLGVAQDYKKLLNDNQGPNTGGMGAFSPVPLLNDILKFDIEHKIIRPLVRTLAEEGHPFNGMLFTGIMLTSNGPKVLEFNARFGDPETQTLLPLVDEDLLPWLMAVSEKRLRDMPDRDIILKPKHSVHVVLASEKYPYSNVEPRPISWPKEFIEKKQTGRKIFFAGVSEKNNRLMTSGGRILGITAIKDKRINARKEVYQMANKIEFEGKQIRTDIGQTNDE